MRTGPRDRSTHAFQVARLLPDADRIAAALPFPSVEEPQQAPDLVRVSLCHLNALTMGEKKRLRKGKPLHHAVAARAKYLVAQFEQEEYDIVCLVETRDQREGKWIFGSFIVVSAKASFAGVGGCKFSCAHPAGHAMATRASGSEWMTLWYLQTTRSS